MVEPWLVEPTVTGSSPVMHTISRQDGAGELSSLQNC